MGFRINIWLTGRITWFILFLWKFSFRIIQPTSFLNYNKMLLLLEIQLPNKNKVTEYNSLDKQISWDLSSVGTSMMLIIVHVWTRGEEPSRYSGQPRHSVKLYYTIITSLDYRNTTSTMHKTWYLLSSDMLRFDARLEVSGFWSLASGLFTWLGRPKQTY